jgi:hypothetical protein
MKDYDLYLLESDMLDIRKKGIIQKDRDDNELVLYKEFITEAKPRKMMNVLPEEMDRAAIKIQKRIRGNQARKRYRIKAVKDGLGEIGNTVNRISGRGVKFAEDSVKKPAIKKLTA